MRRRRNYAAMSRIRRPARKIPHLDGRFSAGVAALVHQSKRPGCDEGHTAVDREFSSLAALSVGSGAGMLMIDRSARPTAREGKRARIQER